MSFENIYYKGKKMKRDTSTKLVGIAIAVDHNFDGSVTVCKEIADEIYANKRIPKRIRNYFKPSEGIKFTSDEFMDFNGTIPK